MLSVNDLYRVMSATGIFCICKSVNEQRTVKSASLMILLDCDFLVKCRFLWVRTLQPEREKKVVSGIQQEISFCVFFALHRPEKVPGANSCGNNFSTVFRKLSELRCK